MEPGEATCPMGHWSGRVKGRNIVVSGLKKYATTTINQQPRKNVLRLTRTTIPNVLMSNC
jgi:hypothetical protein